jgi:pyruvate dehydrogenase E2 component (dihydrolipoamide acetyltransferase)
MGDFTMPSLGADMDKGTLTEWLVHPGDHVAKGDIVAVVQTDKSDVEVEVFETGVVAALLVEPGTEVAVGTPLARIAAEGEAPAPPTPAAPAAAPPAAPLAPEAAPTPEPEPVAAASPARAHASAVLSPLIRHLADTLHVDAEHLAGSGPGGRVTRADVEQAAHAGAAPTVAPRPATLGPSPAVPADGHRRASPLARRRAAAAGIDLASVVGTGPGEAIRAADIDAAAARPAAVPTAAAAAPTSPTAAAPVDRKAAMRSAIARLMAKANAEIPHYHVLSNLDVHDTWAWLAARNAAVTPGERILPAAVLLRATALALVEVPELNGWWRDDHFEPSPHVDLGVAISLRGGGLVTPTIVAAEGKPLAEVMADLRGLATRSRRGGLRGSDLTPASVTVTNLGEQGAEQVIGVIQPPQVALVGFGRPVEAVVAHDGLVAVRSVVRTTVSGDHRATDGHAGSLLLAAIADALAHPERL